MIFTLTELEHHPIVFDVTYEPGEIPFGEEVKQKGTLAAKGQAELLRNTEGEIRIQGHVQVALELLCDRCLADAEVVVDTDFDLFYKPVEKGDMHGEVHLEEGEIDLSFYEGDSVGLRDALREHILLTMPMQVFCRPECKGLCPTCGADRNTEKCECQSKKVDPRLSALKNLK